jgi:hypothetical protein
MGGRAFRLLASSARWPGLAFHPPLRRLMVSQ